MIIDFIEYSPSKLRILKKWIRIWWYNEKISSKQSQESLNTDYRAMHIKDFI